MKKTTPPRPAKIKSESLSEFRYQLRRFLRLSEGATKAEGITPLQYLFCNQDARRPRVCKNLVLPLDQHEIAE
ncbi:hypothetical protein [Noviherbaspirillum autotrophicum]|uniref:hypothetical protein n=1 Tax=Noviherbaspirillum autotrophicum TaxID=709839 RepID=UPI000A49AB2B